MKPKFGFKAVNLGVMLALLVLSCALPSGSVQAETEATFNVTKTADTNDGTCSPTDCSLREAIIAANATAAADTINLPAGAYVLSIAGADEELAATGDLDVTRPLTLTGAGRGTTSIDGADLDRVFDIYFPAGTVSISGVTIKNGTTLYSGGCLQAGNPTLTLTNTALMGCVASQDGGGLYLSSSTVTIDRSVIKNNAGIGTHCNGGGIYAANTNLTITNSQVSNNSASHSGGGVFVSNDAATSFSMTSSLVNDNFSITEAGGLFFVSGLSASVSNSTISGNHTNGYAGGIDTRIPTTLRHITIVNNIANENADSYGNAGGILIYMGEAIGTIQNSIISNNLDMGNANYHDCLLYGEASLTSQGYNLPETPGNCVLTSPGDITRQDPLLGPLQNNGGQSWTHALLPDSPAINAGDPAFAPPPASDQRGTGYPRVQDGRLDIGAFELGMKMVYLPLIKR